MSSDSLGSILDKTRKNDWLQKAMNDWEHLATHGPISDAIRVDFAAEDAY
jgi:hypothetical protein